jgi:hypothetical protein
MSGLDALVVLGAVTSSVQLADAGLGIIKAISDLYSKVHDTPKSILKRTVQVQHLINITNLIRLNPPLQCVLIDSLLTNCRKEAEELLSLLVRLTPRPTAGRIEKCWKAVGGLAKEEKILKICERLEVEKVALTLCITNINS